MQAAEKKKGSKANLWVGLFLGVLLIAAVIHFRKPSKPHSQAGSAQQHAVPIATATAQNGDIGNYLQALGTVVPVYTVALMCRVQGQITHVNYKEGQLVHQGESLIEVDPRPYEAIVVQAEGQLERDLAYLKQAQIDLARYRKAYARNAIPKQQLDDQEQIVRQYEGVVKADQGTLLSAKLNVEYCHLTSPIDGRVGLRLIDPGNMVQANSNTTLAVITQLHPITVIASIPADSLPQIQEQLRLGNEMKIEAYDRSQKKKIAVGSFQSLDNLIDTTTGTVKIRAVFDNSENTLFPNQFVNVKLLLMMVRGTTLASAQAIQHGPTGPFVYVISSSQTAEVRPVKVGITNGRETAIEGVKPGEEIAISGFDKLQNGAKVAVHNQRKEVASNRQERIP